MAAEPGSSAESAAVLCEARRQSHFSGSFCPDSADVCALCGGRGADGSGAVLDVQCDGWFVLGGWISAGRQLLWSSGVCEEEFRVCDFGDCGGVFAAGGD